MMKGAKSYLQKSSGMGPLTVLKCLETILKVIMDKLVLVICLIQVTSFQEAYLERGVDFYDDFLDDVPSASQIKKDARALYGALFSACQIGEGRRTLMENRDKQNGIRSWRQLVQ
jgi:hypothetical protein